ncbi:unnamed protein product [Schistosoma margrebowiei]|uniref:Uncharacterized protein n=1 Tax=Schistosoma margrebowiei TaxID=48269 RepID=A0AA85AIM7_9TREM|nr:unnamed protein product [Schistosoma margrebowiei]
MRSNSVQMCYNFVIYIHFLLFWIHSSIQDDKINMQLSTENQTIDQYMTCRSQIYQSIERKILMGGTTVRNSDEVKKCFTEEQSVYEKLVDEYKNEICPLPNSNNIKDNQQLHYNFRRLDVLLRDRYGKIRVCNIYLFSHDILQTIHDQIDNQLKQHNLEPRKSNVEMAIIYCKDEINMELSTESQTIDEYMTCRSKIYHSIERKILMEGTTVRNSDEVKKCFTEEQSVYEKLVDEYKNEICPLPNSNNIKDNQQLQLLDVLLRDRYGKIRVCNIYLFSHDILQTIHDQIDNQLKRR